jgi:hypothetical protein
VIRPWGFPQEEEGRVDKLRSMARGPGHAAHFTKECTYRPVFPDFRGRMEARQRCGEVGSLVVS